MVCDFLLVHSNFEFRTFLITADINVTSSLDIGPYGLKQLFRIEIRFIEVVTVYLHIYFVATSHSHTGGRRTLVVDDFGISVKFCAQYLSNLEYRPFPIVFLVADYGHRDLVIGC